MSSDEPAVAAFISTTPRSGSAIDTTPAITVNVAETVRRRLTLCRGTADRGSAAVEAVIIVPVIVILSMIVIQFALIWHGRHVAQAAAQSGATAAAGYQATALEGQHAAQEYLSQVAPNLLTAPKVTVTAGGGQVRVDIRARVLTLVPFADFQVAESATTPNEIFAP